MRRLAAVGLLVGALASSGCASGAGNSITTNYDGAGKVTSVTKNLSDEGAYYEMRAQQAQQPSVKLDLTEDGKVKGISINLQAGGGGGSQQYHPAWERVMNQWGPALFSAGLGMYGFNQLAELGKAGIAGAKGVVTKTNVGDGSIVATESAKGQGSSISVAPQTINTDDHSGAAQ